MTDRIGEASPKFKARMAGVFQLLEGLTATYGQVLVLGRVVVADNAAATAANILGHQRLFWAVHQSWVRMTEGVEAVVRTHEAKSGTSF
jgi:hypothetical protein